MRVLALFDYPAGPGGLSTQGDMLYRGLSDIGVEVFGVNAESSQEKEWYYKWYQPDVTVGIGYWGHCPEIVMHPQRFGIKAVPWLVADGYIANYHEVLNALPLILVTSNWVKKVYIRDGLDGKNIEVLPVGIDTDAFVPRGRKDPKVQAVRDSLGIKDNELMILTIGGDAASKGSQEVMQALSIIDHKAPPWKYVCKVWPQARTAEQNNHDFRLATQLGIDKKVIYTVGKVSRNYVPYLMAACDIYAAPSRLEGFGMPQIEANACEKPVIGIEAMAMLDTLVHNKTALLAKIAQEVRMRETVLGIDAGYENGHRVTFKYPRTVDYRASVHDIANYLMELMTEPDLRDRLGKAGRQRVVEMYDYRVVAKKFMKLVEHKLMKK